MTRTTSNGHKCPHASLMLQQKCCRGGDAWILWMQIRGEFNVIFICAMPLLALLCPGGWKTGRLNPQLNYLLSPCRLMSATLRSYSSTWQFFHPPCIAVFFYTSFSMSPSSSMASLALCVLGIWMLFRHTVYVCVLYVWEPRYNQFSLQN